MKIPRAIAFPFLALPWIACVFAVAYLAIQRFPPNGIFVVTSKMDGTSPFANPFLPSERVTPPGKQAEGWSGQRVMGDPTYFNARVPGPYDTVDIDLEFKPVHQPLLEFGVVRDATGNDLELHPMYFESLESNDWRPVADGYVRGGVSDSRLNDSNPVGMALWDASGTMPLLQDSPSASRKTPVALRGTHEIYLVPSGGRIDIAFELQDVNRKRGTSVAAFRVFRGEEEIQREAFTTNASRETAMGAITDHRIAFDATPGVYRIRFQADDDVFIRSIRTTSRRWVIGPRLNVGDVVGYATTTATARVWTNSRHVVAETFHREGLQAVTLGSESVKVVRTHEVFRLDRKDSIPEPVKLEAPVGDIRFVGDGWFSYSPEAFFEPRPRRITDGSNLMSEGIEAIRTSYTRPVSLRDGWYSARFSYALNKDSDQLRFVLSAPGIVSRGGAVDFRKITMTYRRPPISWNAWFDLIIQEVKNAWRRVRS